MLMLDALMFVAGATTVTWWPAAARAACITFNPVDVEAVVVGQQNPQRPCLRRPYVRSRWQKEADQQNRRQQQA